LAEVAERPRHLEVDLILVARPNKERFNPERVR
jgi:hypothetical protein